MTELEIYKFITDNDIECHWYWIHIYGKEKNEPRLYIWIPAYLLKEFCELLGQSAFEDDGYCETTLCHNGYICVNNFDKVLELYGIDAEKVFPKDKFK